MYVPKFYKIENRDEIWKFIKNNSFGTIVTAINEKPVATHVPLSLRKIDNEYYITGHVAYGNPQWKTFESSKDVLVMFQGPDAYISSSWYADEEVPTWNYQAVHIYGQAIIMKKEELIEDLRIMLEKYEAKRENPVLWENLSEELLSKQVKGIVGFKVKIKEVQAAYKLSQNRNKADYNNIIDKLKKEENLDSVKIAELMKSRFDS